MAAEQDDEKQELLQKLELLDDIDLANDDDHNNNNNNNNNVIKAARLPRWTRQEILVLIQGKKVAENRVRRGRNATTICTSTSSSSVEPKWATVSSYCKRHGVNRGAVQCRKRWSNLAGDFKKIKEWEAAHVGDESESFWLMRNDLRRDRKLPGFFDKEVYDILDDKKDVDVDEHDPPLLFDSGRSAPNDDALFDDFDKDVSTPVPVITSDPIPAPVPISAKQYQPFTPGDATPTGVDDEKQAEIGSTSQGERKRKRLVVEDETTTEGASLLQVMEKNGRLLCAQLEAHNLNLKLDRDDRKDHATSLVAVLNKLADALARIADKL